MKVLLSASILALVGAGAQASTLPEMVPYTGSYDENAVPAQDGLPSGDFDTLGGLEQLGLFQLVAGVNTFTGSIYSPTDPADVFLIEILTGLSLVSARLDWATNLPGIEAPDIFNVPVGFLQQNTFNLPQGGVTPSWTVEESDETPTIFDLTGIEASMVGSTFDVAPKTYDAPTFGPRGPGIYSSIFDAGTTCGQTYVPANPGVNATCISALDYTLTFVVEETGEPPINPVPLPAGMVLMGSAFAFFGGGAALRRRRKS